MKRSARVLVSGSRSSIRALIPVPCEVVEGDYGANGFYAWGLDVEWIGLGPAGDTAFILAHEVGHATGSILRTGRKSLQRIGKSRTALMCEEAVADSVAAFIGHRRPASMKLYPTPHQGTRAHAYIQHHAVRAKNWLIKHCLTPNPPQQVDKQ